jgi:hypothetical protein
LERLNSHSTEIIFNFKNTTSDSDDEDGTIGAEYWPSICPSPQFEQYMSFSRFKEFRSLLPCIWIDEARKENDPWYKFSAAMDEFNEIRKMRVKTSQWICCDESMSTWKPRKTALGWLPNISFIIRKPKPLGKKTVISINMTYSTLII